MCESVFNLSLLKGNQASSYFMKFPRWCCQPTIFTPLNLHHIHSQSYQTCSEAVNVPPPCCQSELQPLQVPEERPPAVGSQFWSCDWQLLWNVFSQKSHIRFALPIFLGVPPINGWHVTLRLIDVWGIVSLAFISLLVNTWHTFLDRLTPNCQILNFPLLLFRRIWPMKSLAHKGPLTGWMFGREWCFLRGYPVMNYPN